MKNIYPITFTVTALLLLVSTASMAASFNMKDSLITGTCSDTLYDDGGPGISPGARYSPNLDDTVTILVGGASTINLHFFAFSIHSGDTLFVYDGPNTGSPQLAALNGSGIPSDISSTGQAITIRMKTNGSGQFDGFEMAWEANIDPSITVSDPSPWCIGDTVTFNVTDSTDGGVDPTFVWFVNGTQVDSNVNSYTTSTLSNGDTVTTVMIADTVDGSCIGALTDTSEIIVVVNGLPTPGISSVANLSCNGANDGSATATGGVSYSWNTMPVQNNQTATGLSPGTYIVTVTDANTCQDTTSVTITEPPPLSNSFTIKNATTIGGSDGRVTSMPSGGSGMYYHSWSNGDNTAIINGLAKGFYTDTLRDDSSCVHIDSAFVDEPAPLAGGTINIGGVSTRAICAGDTIGQMNQSSSATGGADSLPYTYTWQQSPDLISWTSFPSSDSTDYFMNQHITANTFIRRRVVDASMDSAFSNVLFLDHIADVVVSIIGLNSTYCDNDPNVSMIGLPAGGAFTSTAYVSGNTFSPSMATSGGASNPVTYTYTDAFACSHERIVNVTVNSADTFTILGLKSVYSATEPADTISATVPGGTFTGAGVYLSNGVWYFDPSLITPPFTQHVKYTLTNSDGCVSEDSIEVTVQSTVAYMTADPAGLSVDVQFCHNPAEFIYGFNGLSGDTIQHFRWRIFNLSRTFYIHYDWVKSYNLPAPAPLLFDATQTIPNALTSVGTPGGTAHLASATPLGATDLVFQFSYIEIGGPTVTIEDTITIVNLGLVRIGADQGNSGGFFTNMFQWCRDNDTVNFTSSAIPLSGRPVTRTFDFVPATTPSNGFTDHLDGTAFLDPASASNLLNTITFTYTDVSSGCFADTTRTVRIDDPPVVTLTGVNPKYCADEGQQVMTGAPYLTNYGDFNSTTIAINHINGNNMASFVADSTTVADNHEITYTFTNPFTGCKDTDTARFDIKRLPDLAMTIAGGFDNPTICVSDSAKLGITGLVDTLTPGFFGDSIIGPGVEYPLGQPGLANFVPDQAGIGTHTISFYYTDGEGCSDVVDSTITVNGLPDASFSVSSNTLCMTDQDTAFFTYTGVSAGTPSYFIPVGAQTPIPYFNPVANTDIVSGVNQVVNEFTDAVTTCVNTDTATITVNDLPVVSITNLQSNYCTNDGLITLVGSPTSLGVGWPTFFSSSPSLSVDSSLLLFGENSVDINIDTTLVGTHTISYTHTDLQGCSNTFDTTMEVEQTPDLGILFTEISGSPADDQLCTRGQDSVKVVGLINGFAILAGDSITGSPFADANNLILDTLNDGTALYGPVSQDTGLVDFVTFHYTDTLTGCSSTFTESLTLHQSPPAAFTVVEDSICPSETGQTVSDYDICVGCDTIWPSVNRTWTVNGLPAASAGEFTPNVDSTSHKDWNIIYHEITDNNFGCVNFYEDSIFLDTFPIVSVFIDTLYCSNGGQFTVSATPASAGGISSAYYVNSWSADTTFLAASDSDVVYFNDSIASSKFTQNTVSYHYTDGSTECSSVATESFYMWPAPVLQIDVTSSTGAYCPYDGDQTFVARIDGLAGFRDNDTVIGVGVVSPITPFGNFTYNPRPPSDSLTSIDTLLYTYTDSTSGCLDTIYEHVTIYPQPKLEMEIDPGVIMPGKDSVCLENGTVTFEGTVYDATRTNPLFGTKRDAKFYYDDEGSPSSTYTIFRGANSNEFEPQIHSAGANTRNKVIFIGQDSATTCIDTIDTFMVIHPTPVATINKPELCVSDSATFISPTRIKDTLIGTAGPPFITDWEWTIDNQGYPQERDSIITVPLASSGNKSVALRVTSDKGCISDPPLAFGQPIPNEWDTLVNFVDPPIAAFDWIMRHECVDTTVTFNNKTNVSGAAVSYFWNFGDNATSTDSTPTHDYQQPGKYEVSLRVQEGECADTAYSDIYMRNMISSFPYLDDFESGNDEWVMNVDFVQQDTIPPVFFEYGQPNKSIIDAAFSGQNAWVTGLDSNYTANVKTSVISPCFDLSGSIRPMIKMMMKYTMDNNDGTVLQFTSDTVGQLDQVEWTNVGEVLTNNNPTGINWYTREGITANPGDQDISDGNIGWSDTSYQDTNIAWREGRHDIDNLVGSDYVRFRIAFASNPAIEDEGFAFDDFQIEERSKNVLYEVFTNSSSNASASDMQKFDGIIASQDPDIVDIQYHTSFPAHDPMNADNTTAPSARSLLYGVSEITYVVGDGNQYNDYVGSVSFNSNTHQLRALEDPAFEVGMNFNTANNQLKVGFTAHDLSNVSSQFTLHIALLEKYIDANVFDASEGVASSFVGFNNVLKKMFPNVSGTSFSKSDWYVGKTDTVTTTIDFVNFYSDTENFKLVAYIQDNTTKEVFQTEWLDNGKLNTGVEEVNSVRGEMVVNLFPNPTNGNTHLFFDQPLDQPQNLNVFNQMGQLVRTFTIPKGTQLYTIDAGQLDGGLYFLIVHDGIRQRAMKKMMVVH